MPDSAVDVSDWEVLELEATGRNSHPWLREANADQAWLFKPVVVKNEHRQGEDWSEYLASRVAGELGVPCAQIRLARRGTWRAASHETSSLAGGSSRPARCC